MNVRMLIILYLFVFVMSKFLVFSAFASCSKGEGACSVLKREAEARKAYMLKETLKDVPLFKGYPPPPSNNNKKNDKSYKKKIFKTNANKEKYSKKKKKFFKSIKRRVATHVVSIPVEVYPNKTVRVRISSKELNRVVCTEGEIGYIYSSSEKGYEVLKERTEVFIKVKSYYNPRKGKIEFNRTPAVFYVHCGDYTFSFVAQPDTRISAKTIYLVSPSKEKKSSLDLFKVNRVDEAIVKIVRAVFLDNIPSSWIKVRNYVPLDIVKEFPSITFNKSQKIKSQETTVKVRFLEIGRYRIPGVKVIVRIFSIGLVKASENEKVLLKEKVFLDPAIVDAPLAISLKDHILSPSFLTRAVVLERTLSPWGSM